MSSPSRVPKDSRFATLSRRFKTRQGVPRIGADYQPAIKAVRGEAPSLSRCSQIWSRQLRRHVHLLSRTEVAGALVALYCPFLVDLLEQRCLPVGPERNPVSFYSDSGPEELRWLPGTLETAERLGLIKFHPTFVAEDVNGPYRVPLSLVGDLLLVLRDSRGVYAVNWNVKLDERGFGERLGMKPLKRGGHSAAEQARARQCMEEECYRDAGIATYRVTGTTFERAFVANLGQIFPWDCRDLKIDSSRREAMVDEFRNIVDSERSPFDLMGEHCRRFCCDRRDFLTVFWQSIWRRELVVDLHQPVLIDRPLCAERIDPFEKYAKLFARGPQ